MQSDNDDDVGGASVLAPLAPEVGAPTPEDAAGTESEALKWFAVRVAAVAAVALAIVTLNLPTWLELLAIGVVTVGTIVTDHRFAWERWLEAHNIPSREAWAPLLMLAALIGFDFISADDAGQAMLQKLDIIAFILSFALLAEGLRRCGFFRYLAYQFAERCHGNTSRLILYLFLLSSFATYVTSNDIVILVMTPIVLAVARGAGLRNATLLLLSQFVAANTVSMGLLIGSPTNLIIGQDQELSFFAYGMLMLVPTVVALMATLVVVDWINRTVQSADDETSNGWPTRIVRRFSILRGWSYQSSYRTPKFTDNTVFNRAMFRWVVIMTAAVVTVMVVTGVGLSLYFAAAPIAVVSLVTLARETRAPHGQRARVQAREVAVALTELPTGIIFFGLGFFVLAAAISNTEFVTGPLTDSISSGTDSNPFVAALAMVFGAGIVTNLINDLPSSALLGGILEQVSFSSPFTKALLTQTALIGVNIGTYVTPVGALAGIIWFDRLRQDNKRAEAESGGAAAMVVPLRSDLIAYGLGVFVVLATVLGITSYTTISVADWLLGPTSGPSVLPGSLPRLLGTLAGIAMIVFIAAILRRQMRRNGVLLVHMVDVFVITNRVRFWIGRNRLGWAVIVTTGLLAAAAGALYWVEAFHASTYNQPNLFAGVGEFINWYTVIVTSGFDLDDNPRTIVGVLLAGALTLGSIAAIIYLVRASTLGRSDTLKKRIASGQIPSHRLVIINATDGDIDLVTSLLRSRSRFVVAVGTPNESNRLQALLERDSTDRAIFLPPEHSPADTVSALDLCSAREVVLLSRSSNDDFANIATLVALDQALGHRPSSVTVMADLQHDADSEGHATESEPGVLFQAYMSETQDLFVTRVSERLRQRTALITVGQQFADFVVAHTSGDPAQLAGFFTEDRLIASAVPDVLDIRGHTPRIVEVPLPQDTLTEISEVMLQGRGANHTGMDTRGPWMIRQKLDQLIISGLSDALVTSPGSGGELPASLGAVLIERGSAPMLIGVVVDDDGTRDHLTLTDLSESSTPRRVVGAVVLDHTHPDGILHEPDAEVLPPAIDSTNRIVMVGTGDVLTTCARRLANRPDLDIVVVHPLQDRTPEALGDLKTVRFIGCTREHKAVAEMTALVRAGTRVVVFDDPASEFWSIERLLEVLSLERLRQISAGATVSPLMVQCNGPRRREFLSRFVVDEVVDSSWLARSYFQVLTQAYFGALRGEEDGFSNPHGGFPTEIRFRAAHHAALALLRFQVLPAHLLTLQLPGLGPTPVDEMDYFTALAQSRVAIGLSGPVVGGARFRTEQRSTDHPMLVMQLLGPSGDDHVDDDDLILLIPHL